MCLNVMPLFHIHGLVANIGVSVYSRARVICSAFMMGKHFVDLLSEGELRHTWPTTPQERKIICFPVCVGGGSLPIPTWYSAVPTMHEAILLEAESRGKDLKHSLTLMRNCSAALLPPVSRRFIKVIAH